MTLALRRGDFVRIRHDSDGCAFLAPEVGFVERMSSVDGEIYACVRFDAETMHIIEPQRLERTLDSTPELWQLRAKANVVVMTAEGVTWVLYRGTLRVVGVFSWLYQKRTPQIEGFLRLFSADGIAPSGESVVLIDENAAVKYGLVVGALGCIKSFTTQDDTLLVGARFTDAEGARRVDVLLPATALPFEHQLVNLEASLGAVEALLGAIDATGDRA